jgi:hypothetical protein
VTVTDFETLPALGAEHPAAAAEVVVPDGVPLQAASSMVAAATTVMGSNVRTVVLLRMCAGNAPVNHLSLCPGWEPAPDYDGAHAS